MNSNSYLNKICSVSKGFDSDRFVGIKVSSGIPEIHFPMGFSLSDRDEEIRKDTFLLLKILKTFSAKEETNIVPLKVLNDINDFPLFAYQRMILRYLNRGNYVEFENEFSEAKSGKINWPRTIKKCKPVFQNNGPVYLNCVVKKSKPMNDSIIAEIYNYCVYCSFNCLGWLYTDRQFKKPKIKFNKNLFRNLITEKLSVTNTDSGKELFSDMLAIIEVQSHDGFKNKNFIFGTYEFEYVWEKLIDNAYGIKNKKDYFPRSYWNISGRQPNHALQPDTIMIRNSIVYVIDAKYYKYGWTGAVAHLPDTSSIYKQIAYGKHIDFCRDFSFSDIYNAFLIPADLKSGPFACDSNLHYIGYATSDGNSGEKNYEKVAGILVDTKYLMNNYFSKKKLTDELSQFISENINKENAFSKEV